ncbi:MAG: hypothetical protein A2X64_01585 [Ignavibacteria bacterium GWF2_33_9]|nr:MAG: hypothetical protein A2X64_01585 [Ignavibacteria bacterium GWF2_33_9]
MYTKNIFILTTSCIILQFILIVNYSNAQTLYSLNNYELLNPSGNSTISVQENSFIPKTSESKLWQASLMIKPNSLGFYDLNRVGAILNYQQSQNSLFSIDVNYFGFDLFNEFAFNLAYCFLDTNFASGIALNYNQVSFKDFGNDNLVKVDLFGKLDLSEFLNVGFYLNNLNRAYYSNYDKTVYQSLLLSAGFKSINLNNNSNYTLAGDFGTIIQINQKSNFFLIAKLSFNDLISVNSKFITNPVISISGISLKLLDWINFTIFFRYQRNFNFEQTFITDFKW